MHGVAQAAEQVQAIDADHGIIIIDHDSGEEGIDRAAQGGQFGHGALVVVAADMGRNGSVDGIDGEGQVGLLGKAQQALIDGAVLGQIELLFLGREDIGGSAIAGEQVDAVVGGKQFAERRDAFDDLQNVVAVG